MNPEFLKNIEKIKEKLADLDKDSEEYTIWLQRLKEAEDILKSIKSLRGSDDD